MTAGIDYLSLGTAAKHEMHQTRFQKVPMGEKRLLDYRQQCT